MTAINIPLTRYLRWKINKLWTLSAFSDKFNLSVEKEEKLSNQLIGLDNVKRKLLLIRKKEDDLDCRIVDLSEVQHCSVNKVYGSISAGDLHIKGLHHYLQSISLKLGFKSGKEPIAINFYERDCNSLKQQNFLEETARKWERLISVLLLDPMAAAQI